MALRYVSQFSTLLFIYVQHQQFALLLWEYITMHLIDPFGILNFKIHTKFWRFQCALSSFLCCLHNTNVVIKRSRLQVRLCQEATCMCHAEEVSSVPVPMESYLEVLMIN